MSDLKRWHTENLDEWCPPEWTDERLYDEFYAFAEARIAELEARLRAADALALAVEAHEASLERSGSADPEPVRQALAAYREAEGE